METGKVESIAQFLYKAEVKKREVPRVTTDHPDLSVEEGYQIQERLVELKQEQGQQVIGYKMGLTSQAKMEQMNVDEPIYGTLFDNMVIADGKLHLRELIHPKVEPEIAFVLGKDIHGPGVSGVQMLAATQYVFPAMEIIDSRYKNFNFTLSDVVADNASSSRVIFGNKPINPGILELDLVSVTLMINGEMKEFGTSAAVLGNPAHSAARLANMLACKGRKLHKGDVILTGAITGAVALSAGNTVLAQFDGLGGIIFSVHVR